MYYLVIIIIILEIDDYLMWKVVNLNDEIHDDYFSFNEHWINIEDENLFLNELIQ
jgi:hypothetical protein